MAVALANRTTGNGPLLSPDNNDRPFVVVLTGGIASGKTTVSDLFVDLGTPVIDTDIIAREIVAPGETALECIVDEFGPEVLQKDGRLDRSFLKTRVFNDDDARTRLERILHPRIMQRVSERLAEVDEPYCVVVIPLYTEIADEFGADRVLVVDANEDIRLCRLLERDSISRALALNILNAQASREQRLRIADDVITNDGNLAELKTKVRELHDLYSRKAFRQ